MQRQPFSTDWYFHLGDLNHEPGKQETIDPAEWRPVTLPHDWSIELPRKAENPSGFAGGYFETGRGYYRKEIDVPIEWQGKRVFVEFEGAYMNAEVWLDEHFVLRHPYGYTSFLADLTPYLTPGQKNVLKVRVDNSSQLNSRWYSGSGIYRPVWLIVTEPVHIAHWGVWVTTPEISSEKAQVHAQVILENTTAQAAGIRVRTRVLSPSGQQIAATDLSRFVMAGAKQTAELDLRVDTPLLWSPETPHLYRLETELEQNGQIVDTDSTHFGIRSLHFSAERGFMLNGRPLKLKGGCVHHDNGILGSASFLRSEERKVELHKASGFNAIRCAHNPPAPAFLDACDRLGMLVIDEAFDCWRDGKNPYDYHVAFDDWWQRDLNAMLLRDRNHPAIILWSIGNEVIERDRPEGSRIARMLAEHVRSVDPTRPVISAICGSWMGKDWHDTDATFAALDVGGYNYQWKQYQPDHDCFPERMMIGTESFPLEALENWSQVEAHPYVLGDFVWTSLDYLGESGIGRIVTPEDKEFLGRYPWHQANCGDLDLCGFKRPQSYYRDMVWGSGDPLYIAVHALEDRKGAPSLWGWPDVWPNWNWAGCEGQTFTVDVYSVYDDVELFLNGRSLGRKCVERLKATFEVVYEPGELKAVGYRNMRLATEKVLCTTGPAARVRLIADRTRLQAAPGDLAFVKVEILDAAGNVHPTADQCVTFTLSGTGALAAVGSADPRSEEPYTGNQRSTFHGRCLTVVKSTGQEGTAVLRAEAGGLEPGEVTLTFA
jgi:beta-galactosidase